MPVYLITLHAYRTWRPDNPRGYVRRGAGMLPPDPEMAKHYDDAAKQRAVAFTDEHQRILIAGTLDVAGQRNWRIHAIGTEPTHIHILLSWIETTGDTTWQRARDKLKSLLGMMLSQHFYPGEHGHKWFVRKGSRRRVENRAHFEHLMTTYLPSHRGRCWSERDAPAK